MVYSEVVEILPDFVKEQIHQIEFDFDSTVKERTKAKVAVEDVWDKTVKSEENLYFWKHQPIYINRSAFNHKNRLNVVELFCGCGGSSTGFEMAGYNIIMGLDIHTPSIETFSRNHPTSSIVLGDIKKVDPAQIHSMIGNKSVDVLIGGIPCQGFSLNNRKRHEDDERNYLYKEFIRFVKQLKPRAIVLENVSGMRSMANGSFHKKIEKELSAAGGMTVRSKLLNAADYGVPQRRTRLVFVGVRGVEFDFSDIKITHGPGAPNPYVTIKEAIGDLPSLAVGESSIKYRKTALSEYQKIMRDGAPPRLQNHEAPSHPDSTVKKIAKTAPGKPMYPKFKQRIRLAWDIQSPTQVSGGIRPQFQFGHPEDARGLSIRERCRLQSFPDSYTIYGGIVQGRVQTGNAIPPLLARAVAKGLKGYLL